MYGRRVRPSLAAARTGAYGIAGLGIVLLLLLPTNALLGGHGTTSPPAPRAGTVPVAIAETRAALASLPSSVSPTLSPDPWTNLTSASSPSPSAREGEALVYDPAGPYVLLFGGATGAGSVHDTWTFANGKWTNLSANLSSWPSSRYKPIAVWDASDGYVLLFSGRASHYYNDTWIWQDGAWSELTPALAPPAREDSMAAYDPDDGYVVLFGGEDTANVLLNDTWTYHAGVWTNITDLTHPAPPTREAGAMTWDTADNYVLLFGGSNDPRGDLRDTWSYRGGVWTNLTNLTASHPSKRETLMMTDDPLDGFVVLYGGLKFPNSLSDTWAYSNGTWTLLNVGTAPPPRWGGEVTWDANGGLGFVLLFGGVSSPYANATYRGDTWSFKVALAANITTPNPLRIDLSGSANLTVAARGGYPAYSYGWRGLPPGCTSANASTLSCRPAALGSYNVTAWVTDAAGTNVSTAPLQVLVDSMPTVAATVTPLQGSVPFRVSFNSTISGGAAPYTYDWLFGDGGSSNLSGGTYLYTSSGTFTPSLTIFDSVGSMATAPALPAITVNAGLTASIVASTTSGLAPLSVDFSADVAGGWAPYTYLWALGPEGVTSTEPSPSYTFLTPGTYPVSVNVTDELGGTVLASTTINVEAALPLMATATASPASGTAPLGVTLGASATGGTAPYTFAWSFGDGSLGGSGTSVMHSYPTVGNYTATVTATDAAGTTAQATVVVNVTASPPGAVPFNASFTFTVGSAYCAAGSSVAAVTLTASAVGGAAPYSFTWVVGTTVTSGPTAIVTVPAGATTSLFLNASDSGGHLLDVSHTTSVGALSCSTSSDQGVTPPDLLLLLLIAAVAVVVAIEAVLLLRRK